MTYIKLENVLGNHEKLEILRKEVLSWKVVILNWKVLIAVGIFSSSLLECRLTLRWARLVRLLILVRSTGNAVW